MFGVNRSRRRQANQTVDRHVSAVDRHIAVECHHSINRRIRRDNQALQEVGTRTAVVNGNEIHSTRRLVGVSVVGSDSEREAGVIGRDVRDTGEVHRATGLAVGIAVFGINRERRGNDHVAIVAAVNTEARRIRAVGIEANVLMQGHVAIVCSLTTRVDREVIEEVVTRVVEQAQLNVTTRVCGIGRGCVDRQVNARGCRENRAAGNRQIDSSRVTIGSLFGVDRSSRRQANVTVDRDGSAIHGHVAVQGHDADGCCVCGDDQTLQEVGSGAAVVDRDQSHGACGLVGIAVVRVDSEREACVIGGDVRDSGEVY